LKSPGTNKTVKNTGSANKNNPLRKI